MKIPALVFVAGLALAAFAAPAGAHAVGPVTLGGITPATLDLDGLGVVRLGACQSLPTVGGTIPLFCGVNGFGAVFGVSGVDNGDAHSHATGTCKVVPSVPMLLGNDYFYSCGTDRNDDGLVTDAEVCKAEDRFVPHPGSGGVTNREECSGQAIGSGADELHADDWVDGCWAVLATAACPSPSKSADFCFHDDVQAFTAGPDDDTGLAGHDVSALNQAGGSWDDVEVFVGFSATTPLFSIHAGAIAVTLTIIGQAQCWFNVSGHSTPGNTRTDQGLTVATPCGTPLLALAPPTVCGATPCPSGITVLGPGPLANVCDNPV